VRSDVAVLIIAKKRGFKETEIEIISCAGGTGVLSISYSAHLAYMHNVRNFLIDRGSRLNLKKRFPTMEELNDQYKEKLEKVRLALGFCHLS
jgi:uncharacterized protein YutE (UPF0331/DUF86 family)